MDIALKIVACLAGLAIIVCIVMQTSTADAGFSAAMGGSSGSSSAHKGPQDLLLERVIKVAAVVWIVACLALAVLGAHSGGGPAV
jgi:protein translocase SecG subunit